MVYVTVNKDFYSKEEDVARSMEYLCDIGEYGHEITGGNNMEMLEEFDPSLFSQQFLAVQKGKKCTRRFYYITIEFNNTLVNGDMDFIYSVGLAVASMYPEYQSVFAVHGDKSSPVLHIMFNNCPVYPGKGNLTNSFDWYFVKELADRLVGQYLERVRDSRGFNKVSGGNRYHRWV